MTVANFAYPGSYSGYIPSWEATGQLIEFTRDPAAFRINRYAEYINTKKPAGVYAELDADQPVRVVTDDDFAWPDGAQAPDGNDNLMPFRFRDFRCVRKAYPFTIGDEAADNTDWKVIAAHTDMAQSQCMTARTIAAAAVAQNTANWSNNTAKVQTLVPGITGWYGASDDEGSPNFLAIKRSLMAAARQINLYTNGKVKQSEMHLVLNPDDALNMANTAEIHSYLARSPAALAQVRGDSPGQNTLWGLPDMLYGFSLEVDDSPKVTSRPSSPQSSMTAGTRSYIWQQGSPTLLSRPGKLGGQYGRKSFSTLQIFFYREMEVYTKDDRDNERTKGRVVESRAVILAAPAAGFLFQNVNQK